MNSIFKPIFKNILSIKTTWLFILFALFPFMLIIISLINTNFMQLSGEKNSLSAIEFFSSTMVIQHNAVIPFIIISYLVSIIYFGEVEKKQLYFYKDLPKTKIFNSKYFSLVLVYIMYIFLLMMSSIVVYYLQIIKMPLASGELLPTKNSDIQFVIIETLGVMFAQLIAITFSILMSQMVSNGYSILSSLVFYLILSVAPLLNNVNILVPNGYISMLDNHNFSNILMIMFILFIIYISILYICSLLKYKKVEY